VGMPVLPIAVLAALAARASLPWSLFPGDRGTDRDYMILSWEVPGKLGVDLFGVADLDLFLEKAALRSSFSVKEGCK